MRKHFKGLFKHTKWANERLLICLEKEGIKDQKLIKLYSHIVSVETIWLLRIRGLPTSPFPIWQTYSIEKLKTMTQESGDNWLRFLSNHKSATFQEMVFYQDSKGTKHENTIGDILSHVITHGAHHRGQLNVKIRELGIEPPTIDYIYFKWLN